MAIVLQIKETGERGAEGPSGSFAGGAIFLYCDRLYDAVSVLWNLSSVNINLLSVSRRFNVFMQCDMPTEKAVEAREAKEPSPGNGQNGERAGFKAKLASKFKKRPDEQEKRVSDCS